jgi:hypothetical protein
MKIRTNPISYQLLESRPHPSDVVEPSAIGTEKSASFHPLVGHCWRVYRERSIKADA